MTYETRNRILCISETEEVKLNQLEHEMLICLSTCNIVSYQEIKEYFKIIDFDNEGVKEIKDNLLKKSKNTIEIKTIKNVGYRLENEIWFM